MTISPRHPIHGGSQPLIPRDSHGTSNRGVKPSFHNFSFNSIFFSFFFLYSPSSSAIPLQPLRSPSSSFCYCDLSPFFFLPLLRSLSCKTLTTMREMEMGHRIFFKKLKKKFFLPLSIFSFLAPSSSIAPISPLSPRCQSISIAHPTAPSSSSFPPSTRLCHRHLRGSDAPFIGPKKKAKTTMAAGNSCRMRMRNQTSHFTDHLSCLAKLWFSFESEFIYPQKKKKNHHNDSFECRNEVGGEDRTGGDGEWTAGGDELTGVEEGFGGLRDGFGVGSEGFGRGGDLATGGGLCSGFGDGLGVDAGGFSRGGDFSIGSGFRDGLGVSAGGFRRGGDFSTGGALEVLALETVWVLALEDLAGVEIFQLLEHWAWALEVLALETVQRQLGSGSGSGGCGGYGWKEERRKRKERWSGLWRWIGRTGTRERLEPRRKKEGGRRRWEVEGRTKN